MTKELIAGGLCAAWLVTTATVTMSSDAFMVGSLAVGLIAIVLMLTANRKTRHYSGNCPTCGSSFRTTKVHGSKRCSCGTVLEW